MRKQAIVSLHGFPLRSWNIASAPSFRSPRRRVTDDKDVRNGGRVSSLSDRGRDFPIMSSGMVLPQDVP
jgi:hypothetical protein